MKKLTDIIKENNLFVQFKYSAKINISGTVAAENEGAAGEQVDKDIDVIVDHLNKLQNNLSDGTYEIIDIEEKNSITESIDNNKVLESLDADRQGELYVLGQQIAETIQSEHLRDYSGEELRFLIGRISSALEEIVDKDEDETQTTKKLELTLDNVNSVPEADHILTAEDIQKINQYYQTELQADVSDNVPDTVIGKTLKVAANTIYPEFEGFADENLMHFIVALFGNKYEGVM